MDGTLPRPSPGEKRSEYRRHPSVTRETTRVGPEFVRMRVSRDRRAHGTYRPLAWRSVLPALPLGVSGAPVSRDDFEAGMRYQPTGQGSSGPIWQQVDGSALVSIDQNRAVGAAAALAPIVNTQHTSSTSSTRGRPTRGSGALCTSRSNVARADLRVAENIADETLHPGDRGYRCKIAWTRASRKAGLNGLRMQSRTPLATHWSTSRPQSSDVTRMTGAPIASNRWDTDSKPTRSCRMGSRRIRSGRSARQASNDHGRAQASATAYPCRRRA
jgi:hypothetical protein